MGSAWGTPKGLTPEGTLPGDPPEGLALGLCREEKHHPPWEPCRRGSGASGPGLRLQHPIFTSRTLEPSCPRGSSPLCPETLPNL